MISEQIAELRAAIQALDAKTLPVRPVPVRMVEKLLDEREALLGALKMLAPDGGEYEPPAGAGPLEFRTKLTRDDWRQVQAAIAKAEAE